MRINKASCNKESASMVDRREKGGKCWAVERS